LKRSQESSGTALVLPHPSHLRLATARSLRQPGQTPMVNRLKSRGLPCGRLAPEWNDFRRASSQRI